VWYGRAKEIDFTFTKPVPGDSVEPLRHEGGAAGIKIEE